MSRFLNMTQIKCLPFELQKVAEIELGEVAERKEYVEILKSWLEQQPHIKGRFDQQFLIQFLRGCKYDLVKAAKKIDNFFTLKTKFPKLLNATDVTGAKFKEIYNFRYAIPLPRPLNNNGPRIVLLKPDGDVSKGLIDIEELHSVFNAMHEIFLMDDPYACINGIVYIVDLRNLTYKLVMKCNLNFLRRILQFYEKALPLRIKGVYMINMPSFFHIILKILLPLISDKLKQRVSVSGSNYDNLLKIIPQKFLPTYLGGENGSEDEILADFSKKWSQYADYFKENENYGTNELLRPGKPIDFDGLFGLGGSFRKLGVD